MAQRRSNECGLACLSMVTGETLDEVAAAFGRDPCEVVDWPKLRAAALEVGEDVGELPEVPGVVGATIHEMQWYLSQRGYVTALYHDWGWFTAGAWPRAMQREGLLQVPGLAEASEWVQVRGVGILAVPSKVMVDGWHWIVVDRGRVLDPTRNPQKRYAAAEQIPVGDVLMVMNEVRDEGAVAAPAGG